MSLHLTYMPKFKSVRSSVQRFRARQTHRCQNRIILDVMTRVLVNKWCKPTRVYFTALNLLWHYGRLIGVNPHSYNFSIHVSVYALQSMCMFMIDWHQWIHLTLHNSDYVTPPRWHATIYCRVQEGLGFQKTTIPSGRDETRSVNPLALNESIRTNKLSRRGQYWTYFN